MDGQLATLALVIRDGQLACGVVDPACGGQLFAVTAGSPPVNTVAPAVTGSATVGNVLSCTTGTWSGAPAPTYAYQWKQDGTPIGGATSSTYTTVSGDVGHAITCTVTATNSVGSASATSNAVSVTQAPANTVAPVISGTLLIGSALSTTNGTWTGTPAPTFTYQWQRGGANIAAATASSYTLVAADIPSAITCVVTATNSAGNAPATSNALQYDPANISGAIGSYRAGTWVLDGSNNLQTLTDRSAAGHDLTQATSALRLPVSAADANFNGLPSIGPGSGNLRIAASSAALFKCLSDGTGATILATLRPHSTGVQTIADTENTGSGNALGAWLLTQNTAALRLNNGTGAADVLSTVTNANTFAADTPHVITATAITGGAPDSVIRIDRVQRMTANFSAGAPSSNPNAALTLFNLAGGGNPFLGTLVDFTVLNRVASATELSTYEAYAARWGV